MPRQENLAVFAASMAQVENKAIKELLHYEKRERVYKNEQRVGKKAASVSSAIRRNSRTRVS
jgi:hypothetical protein